MGKAESPARRKGPSVLTGEFIKKWRRFIPNGHRLEFYQDLQALADKSSEWTIDVLFPERVTPPAEARSTPGPEGTKQMDLTCDGQAGRIRAGGALCIVRGSFICDICKLPGVKNGMTQKRHTGECQAEGKRRASERRFLRAQRAVVR